VRVLITGVSGFAGSYLAEHLLAYGGYQIWGAVRQGPGQAAHLEGQVHFVSAELTEPEQVRDLLTRVQPEAIYHLAGQSFVAASWRDPWQTLETNIRGLLNLIEGLYHLKLGARLLSVGSNEEYGLVRPDDLPIRETTPARPNSPYGVSKAAQDLLGLQYFLSYGLPIIRVRPFNHIGPRQNDRFVAQAFARQIAEAEAGLRPATIQVGNLDAARDFSDVRDVVRAYHLLMEQGQPGEVYNVGSGTPHKVHELLDLLLSLSQVTIRVETDPERLRPSDVPISYADISKITATVGWTPRIPFEQSVYDVLTYWRDTTKQLSAERPSAASATS
jgi:GDP-4-dehydro-6-deoxy-D-mannose reductase